MTSKNKTIKIEPIRILMFLDSYCSILGWRSKTWREWLGDLLITFNNEQELHLNCGNEWQKILTRDMDSRIDIRIVKEWGSDGLPKDIDWNLQRQVFKEVVYIFGVKP